MEMLETKLVNGHLLSSEELEFICERAISILMKEPNVVYITTPVNICGDIHGQFYDLLNIFRRIGAPTGRKYIFLGDYVDRGANSIETISLLLLYKVMYPENITLLRGNHETREISRIYGFYEEIKSRYGSSHLWWLITEVFEFFNIAGVIDGRIFCVHGGISPQITSIHQLQRITRFERIQENSPIHDILWSDPFTGKGFEKNNRGAGYLYGNDVVRMFLELNDMMRVVRSHQLVIEGYKINFPDESCVTVWSAPNYVYRCGNLASVYTVQEDLEIDIDSFTIIEEVSHQRREVEPPKNTKKNFL